MLHLGPETRSGRSQRQHREQTEFHPDHELQNDARHEFGNRRAGQPQGDHGPVGRGVPSSCGEYPTGDADGDGQEKTQPDQTCGSTDRRPQNLGHRTVLSERVTEVEGDRAPDEIEVLHRQWVEQSQTLVQSVNRLLRCERSQDPTTGIAGEHVVDEEDDRDDEQQCEQRGQHSAYQHPPHRVPLSMRLPSTIGRPGSGTGREVSRSIPDGSDRQTIEAADTTGCPSADCNTPWKRFE